MLTTTTLFQLLDFKSTLANKMEPQKSRFDWLKLLWHSIFRLPWDHSWLCTKLSDSIRIARDLSSLTPAAVPAPGGQGCWCTAAWPVGLKVAQSFVMTQVKYTCSGISAHIKNIHWSANMYGFFVLVDFFVFFYRFWTEIFCCLQVASDWKCSQKVCTHLLHLKNIIFSQQAHCKRLCALWREKNTFSLAVSTKSLKVEAVSRNETPPPLSLNANSQAEGSSATGLEETDYFIYVRECGRSSSSSWMWRPGATRPSCDSKHLWRHLSAAQQNWVATAVREIVAITSRACNLSLTQANAGKNAKSSPCRARPSQQTPCHLSSARKFFRLQWRRAAEQRRDRLWVENEVI